MAGIDNNTLLYLRGDSFKDLSLNPNTVTNTNTTISNNNYIFDNDNEKIEIPIFNINSNWTIEFNVIYDIVDGVNTDKIIQPIMGNVGEESASTYSLSLGELKNRKVCTSYSTNGTTWSSVQTTTTVEANKSYHLATVKEGTTLKTYINGVLSSTASFSGSLKTYTYPFKIGYWRATSNTTTYRFKGKLNNIRISNVVRYTGDFTPPADPFTSVSVGNLNLSNNQLTFGVTKLSANETINKVDIVVNNKVIHTITSNYDSISYTIDESVYGYGDNIIEARAYYFDNYYVSASTTHRKELVLEEFEPIADLPTTASFDDVIAHLGRVSFANRAMLNNLQALLEEKGFNTGESPRLSTLIKVVKDLSNSNSADITEYVNRIIALESEVANLRAKEIDHTKLEYIGVHGAFSGGTYPYNYEYSYSGATRAHYMLRIPTNGANSVKCTFSGYKATAHPYKSNSAFISDLGWFTSGTTYALPEGTDFVIMYFGKTDGSAFTTTDINTIRSNFKYEFTDAEGIVGSSKTYLYKAGDTCTSITGGWESVVTLPTSYWGSGVSKGTMNSDNIYLKATSGRTFQYRTTSNKIDFSDYSKLWIEYSHTQKTGTYAHTIIRLFNELSESGDWVKRSNELAYTTSKATAYMDVSDVTGSYYVSVSGSVENTGAVDFYVYNIWLE